MTNLNIYQLYYNDTTKSMCSKYTEHIDTRHTVTPFLESYFIATLPVNPDSYFGVLSPRFQQKTGLNIPAKKSLKTRADVYSPYTAIGNRLNVWQQGQQAHRHLYEIASLVLHYAGLDSRILSFPTYNIYCNYWVMRSELVLEYRETWMLPVIEACRLPQLAFVFDRCHYNPGHKGASAAQLQAATGYPYYTFAPFIAERLIGSFVYSKKLNLEHWNNLSLY